MRQGWSVVRSRATLIFGVAIVTVLVLPINAFAVAVHMPREQAGSTSASALDVVLILGGVAAALLLILAVRRLRTSKVARARPVGRTAVE